MKRAKVIYLLLAAFFLTAANLNFARDLNEDIPEINMADLHGFEKTENVAQYMGADWSDVRYVARGISLSEAFEIANKNPEITFFFYVKGMQLVLGNMYEDYRIFRHGDVVFFSGKPWWGAANGLSDGFVKKVQIAVEPEKKPEPTIECPFWSLLDE